MARALVVSALSFLDVHAGYGPYRALNGLTLQVRDAENVAVLGRNGAGKSTLARVASGLVAASSGSVEVLGRTLHKTAPHVLARDGVVHLPEGVGLFVGLTVEENLVLHVGGSSPAQRAERLARAYDALGALRDRRRSRAGQLSGGQQRLVAVAAALAAAPRLLLADEPALGLSPAAADDVYEALARAASSSTTLVVIETRLQRVEELCARAVVLDRGQVAYDATIRDTAGILAAMLGDAGAA